MKKSLLMRVPKEHADHLAVISRVSRKKQSELLREALHDLLRKYQARGREYDPAALPEAAPPRPR